MQMLDDQRHLFSSRRIPKLFQLSGEHYLRTPFGKYLFNKCAKQSIAFNTSIFQDTTAPNSTPPSNQASSPFAEGVGRAVRADGRQVLRFLDEHVQLAPRLAAPTANLLAARVV